MCIKAHLDLNVFLSLGTLWEMKDVRVFCKLLVESYSLHMCNIKFNTDSVKSDCILSISELFLLMHVKTMCIVK